MSPSLYSLCDVFSSPFAWPQLPSAHARLRGRHRSLHEGAPWPVARGTGEVCQPAEFVPRLRACPRPRDQEAEDACQLLRVETPLQSLADTFNPPSKTGGATLVWSSRLSSGYPIP